MNYLNVSYYEGCFTYYHEVARQKLNEIYDRLSKPTFNTPPSLEDCIEFYDNVNYLRGVTVTDDKDYYCYMCELRGLIALYKRTGTLRITIEEEEEEDEVFINYEQQPKPTEEELEEYYFAHENGENDEEEEWWENENLLRLELNEWSDQIRSNEFYDE